MTDEDKDGAELVKQTAQSILKDEIKHFHLVSPAALKLLKLANIAIGFIDIDRFKQLNDTCGHQAGDDALKIVADILRDSGRPGDFIGRYGGEEFLFVLKSTDEAGAYGYAERIRSEIERRGKILSRRFHGQIMTASIGVSLYSPRYTKYTDMIEVADQAMYRAKNEGRNRTVLLSGIETLEK